jgi:hypothetical protein
MTRKGTLAACASSSTRCTDDELRKHGRACEWPQQGARVWPRRDCPPSIGENDAAVADLGADQLGNLGAGHRDTLIHKQVNGIT